ncbi:uncharacterized protein LOC131302644 isoform X3 [Rhododendron vialii]|uniref:uncharacterized protein LOC131302644 isoform X3 n=1 Tax=Rhododendron vialii TaxID=182163 RepID=UPI00265E83A8|nr:uncharacterized protein LOC131302644 isoform X3 [Rhododendron vialii]
MATGMLKAIEVFNPTRPYKNSNKEYNEETLFSMTRGLPFKGNRYDTEACPLPNLSIMLRVYMYTYGAISQYVFNVHSIFHSIADQQALQEAPLQILEPKTPKKHGITNK